jgi:5'-3' exonuclease
MGIPRFAKWLYTRDSYETKNGNSRGKIMYKSLPNAAVKTLSIDLNGLIHKAAQKTYAYGAASYDKNALAIQQERQAKIKNLNLNREILEQDFLSQITTDLSNLYATLNPNRMILCVDGVAPIGKMKQQRLRRYKVATKGQADPDLINGFDTTSITPGTTIMEKIHSRLLSWIDQQPYSIHYSSYLEPGEGEHKIFNLMRNSTIYRDASREYQATSGSYPKPVNISGVHVVYGLDADLVMLSLVSPLNNILLVREQVQGYNSRISDVVNIDNLRRSVETQIGEGRIDDFVIAMFLGGNDFLPRMPYALNPERFPEALLNNLTSMTNRIVDSNRITLDGLREFFSLMSSEEKYQLEAQVEEDIPFPYESMKESTTITDVGGISTYSLNRNKFRRMWYDKEFKQSSDIALRPLDLMEPSSARQVAVDEMCNEYLLGLQWNYQYYITGQAMRWWYSFNSIPLAYDLSSYVNKITSLPILNVDEDIPVNPIHQMLLVIPYQSRYLVPSQYREAYEDQSPLVDQFPRILEIESEGTLQDWEHKPRLPPFTPDIIIEGVTITPDYHELYKSPLIDETTFSHIARYDNTYEKSARYHYNQPYTGTSRGSMRHHRPMATRGSSNRGSRGGRGRGSSNRGTRGTGGRSRGSRGGTIRPGTIRTAMPRN